MEIPPEFEWLPGQEGRRGRCMICPRSAASNTGLKPSGIEQHLKTAGHADALRYRAHLEAAEPASDEDDNDRAEEQDAVDEQDNQIFEDNNDFQFDFQPPLVPDHERRHHRHA
ncbi:unnamed protein product [Tilletia laevis]|nr:unnamed protein product [Tilletia caries]CAD6925718.1 unnamed protein product [Tilletia laevis]